MHAVELVHAQPQLAVEARCCQVGQDGFQVAGIAIRDAVGHDLVEAKAEVACPATPAALAAVLSVASLLTCGGLLVIRSEARVFPGNFAVAAIGWYFCVRDAFSCQRPRDWGTI